MQPFEGDFFISQICAGFTIIDIGGQKLKVYPPTKDIWYESNYTFIEVYEQALEGGCVEEEDLFKHLCMNGWKDENLKELEDILPKHIEYFKTQIYETFLRKGEREKARTYLRTAEREYNRLFALRHSLDHLTAVGVATFSRWQFLIEKTTRNMDGSPFNFAKASTHAILSAYYESQLDDLTIREVAKTDKWKSIWQFGKRNNRIFNCEAIESTDEQRKIVAWSSLYDSIHEMPDCPTEDVINDNDAFDGWLILKDRQQKQDRKKANAEDRFAVHGNADEIFVPVKSNEEADSIDSLNSVTSRNIIKNRLDTIRNHGFVTDDQFSDVRMKNTILANQSINNAMSERTK